jgi:glycogen synthase
MNILIGSYKFYPNVGGIEITTELLASEFVKKGHSVKVLTTTAETGDKIFKYEVIRNPVFFDLIRAFKWCDIYYLKNISIKLLWPFFIFKKPLVIRHECPPKKQGFTDIIKYLIKKVVMSASFNISVSKSTAEDWNVSSFVCGGPYDSNIFKRYSNIEKEKDLVFIGRLVSDKGLSVLLESLAILKKKNIYPITTIIGDGPEKEKSEREIHLKGMNMYVNFVGEKSQKTAAEIINSHRFIIVPSLWKEPFAIVTMEGMACGCIPIVSDDNGMAEAVGKFGYFFKRGDSVSLAEKIEDLLSRDFESRFLERELFCHVKKYYPDKVADMHLEIFINLLKKR